MNIELKTIHPAADAFPMMDSKRFSELKINIQKNGLLEPITLYQNKVLDGRNRHKACQELGIIPRYKEVYNIDPWSYVWSLNGERRDLGDEQRYLIWKFCGEQSEAFQSELKRIQEEANLKRSEATKEQPRTETGLFEPVRVVGQNVQPPAKKEAKTRQVKAEAAKVNLGAVARGDKLYKERPDLAQKVMAGDIKPAEAHRQMKKDEVQTKVSALPDGKYRVIYADPPWEYNDAQAVKGDYGTGTGAANSHYPTMTFSELKELNVSELSADDSVLFLWATAPLIVEALDLCKAWGFKYKAQFIWDKVKHNMGHYNSVRHELLLICTKGSCTPDNVKLFDSVQSIERTEHSRKPEEFRNIIDTLYQHGKKIELFRRGNALDGWNVWGNESNVAGL